MNATPPTRPAGAVGRRTAPAHVIQGHQSVSDDPAAMLTTILGSCISACLWDAAAGVGGMNHFLLPGRLDGAAEGEEERLGVHAMELLINELLTRGGSRRRLEAKVFGGANMNSALKDVGALNAAFARQFLKREGIPIVGHCLGGRLARRVQFWPTVGRARRILLHDVPATIRVAPEAAPLRPAASGSLELF